MSQTTKSLRRFQGKSGINMAGAETLAKALGGRQSVHGWVARCPAHDDHEPSLSIRDGANGKVLFHCFVCDQAKVLATLRSLNLWETEPRHNYRKNGFRTETPLANEADRTAAPISIWCEAGNIDGTVVLTYLLKRGTALDNLPNLHHALRWHPSCPWEGGRHGCMVALFTDAITGQPKAIHRTAITPAGEKIGRKMLGPIAGSVIRLWPDETVTGGLVLGEGLETVLVAATRIEHRGTYLRPAWSTGSAGSMGKFPVLAGVEALTLLVDHDESGTGQKAAEECSARWTAAGREVFRLVPNVEGDDFADIIRRCA